MLSPSKLIVIQLLATAFGVGLVAAGVSFLAPTLFVAYPWLATLVDIWAVGVLIGVLWLGRRLLFSDDETAQRRKDRHSAGWRAFEEQKAKGMARRQMGYARSALVREREGAERRARAEAAEREGVGVQFRPQRDSGNDSG